MPVGAVRPPGTTTAFTGQHVNEASMVSTVIDAALAFGGGRHGSGFVLLGAAALSSKVPGLGSVVSLFLRLVRWLR